MTEQQVWFVMIFSIPFIPAVVVFLFIKPQGGDARVGGSIPILKDLRLELGGAVATYVAIVIFAIIAYWVITKNQAVAFEIVPVTPAGQLADAKEIDWLRVEAPELIIRIEKREGVRVQKVNGFVLDPTSHEFVSKSPLYFSPNLIGRDMGFEIVDNPSALGEVERSLLSPRMRLEMKLKGEMFYDWMVRLDHLSYSISTTSNSFVIRRMFVLTNASKSDRGRIEFSPWSIDGLESLSLNVFRLNRMELGSGLSKVDQVSTGLPLGDQRLAELRNAEHDLLKTVSEVGRAQWTRGGQDPIGFVLGDDAAKIYVAPTPRVDNVPGGVSSGESVIVLMLGKGTLASGWKVDIPPAVALYSHPTERSVVSIEAEGSQFCDSAADVLVDAPEGSHSLNPELVRRSAQLVIAWPGSLKKASKVTLPLRWHGGTCL